MTERTQIGLIGLAVMGQNLVLNIERNGFGVAVYNRTKERTDEFMEGPAAGKNITPAYDMKAFVQAIDRPRRILLMIKAGPPVDAVLDELTPLLDSGDLVMDCGNSFFEDTERRYDALAQKGIRYLGVGVSGGEEGALWGPSIMPGGQRDAYEGFVESVFRAVAANVDGDPCVTYLGPGGAGHFVKMVHNGIEYGDMQLIAEAYDILQRGAGFTSGDLHDVFSRWNEGVLSSYLIEITADIFSFIDEETGVPLVERILDTAKQKGTGRWTSETALKTGVPIPAINAAVEARVISSLKEERRLAAGLLSGPKETIDVDRDELADAVGDALYASKICAYAQGFALMQAVSEEKEYDLDFGEIARIWRGGCIIRAKFLDDVREAYSGDSKPSNLMTAPFFREALESRLDAWRKVVSAAVRTGIAVPAMGASLFYYDSYRSERLPANLIQAQRDYFGAHTYQRTDREGVFHTEWQKPDRS